MVNRWLHKILAFKDFMVGCLSRIKQISIYLPDRDGQTGRCVNENSLGIWVVELSGRLNIWIPCTLTVGLIPKRSVLAARVKMPLPCWINKLKKGERSMEKIIRVAEDGTNNFF